MEFRYQPEGWKKEYQFVALRTEKEPEEVAPEESEQYQHDPVYFVVWFYNQRAGAENLITEANNDARQRRNKTPTVLPVLPTAVTAASSRTR
jgi:hypothetical protein